MKGRLKMITVVIDYERISPVVLVTIIESSIQYSMCWYKDVNDNYFEFTVDCEDKNISDVENILKEFV